MRTILLLLALMAIALVVQAPAWLVGRSIQARTDGLVELRRTAGTVWNGEADAVVKGGPAAKREIFLGRVAWRAERIDWQQRAVSVSLRQTPAGPRPATITLGGDHLRVAGGARLPAALAGSIRWLAGWALAGDVAVDSDGLEWTGGSGTGAATAVWRGAILVPPDLPGGIALGEVTARVAVTGAAATVSIANSGGDIELAGEASSQTGRVSLSLQPRAGATAAQVAWLQSHTMGRTARGYTIDAGWPGR